jgi:site-specific DNA-methyltransferase (adenine-specific)
MSTLAAHNPDILTCLANLSADEVFTPPKLASAMLDLLPQDLFSRPDTTFLDPVCKSGVFLREIAKRLNDGLGDQMPDTQARIDHILTKQVFGLAVTELTGHIARRTVYCSKKADGRFSIATAFKRPDGNIRLPRAAHSWGSSGRCELCGVNRDEFDRDETLESHAYPFIHGVDPTKEFSVKFDVILGNPPYQLDTGGSGRQARPIYQLFIEQAKKLDPRYLSMVLPARWFAGGMGLADFRQKMLADRRVTHLVDFPNASDVFPGVDIAGGVCYFLWERDRRADCAVTSVNGDARTSMVRPLDEFPIFVRDSRAVAVVRKIKGTADFQKGNLTARVSAIRPFGIPTNYEPKASGVPCWFIQRIGRKFANADDLTDSNRALNKWKLLVPKAPIAGQTDFTKPIRFYHNRNAFIAAPGEACTESWIVAGAFSSKTEAISYKSYLFTKAVRFLILQTVVSQDVNRMNFAFVPNQDRFDGEYTDEMLAARWGLTDEEIEYIDSRILPTDGVDE